MELLTTARLRAGRLAPGMTVTAALAVTLAACSSPGSATPRTTTSHRPAATSAAAAVATKSAPPPASSAGALSGTWRGQYGGAYQGTFVLRWHQSGKELSGHIHISNPPGSPVIRGRLSGSSIKFGTVGSFAVSYTGTVSGNSMSGNWTIGSTGQGGNWSASKG
jgi:hypothetical protein